jgi:hypothetical protein
MLPMPLLCVVAAFLGAPTPSVAPRVTLEAVRPIQSSGWGERTAPAGSHQLERGRLRANATRPGFQSTFALPQANAFPAPTGAAPLAEADHSPVLAQRSEGAHFGRSPPSRS